MQPWFHHGMVLQVNLMRERLELTPVYSTTMQHDGHTFGYIRLVSFSQKAAVDVQHAIASLQVCPCLRPSLHHYCQLLYSVQVPASQAGSSLIICMRFCSFHLPLVLNDKSFIACRYAASFATALLGLTQFTQVESSGHFCAELQVCLVNGFIIQP